MSAPHTDPKEEAKRHRAPLFGLGMVVLLAVVLLGLFTIVVVYRGNTPEGAEVRMDDFSGEVEDVEGASGEGAGVAAEAGATSAEGVQE